MINIKDLQEDVSSYYSKTIKETKDLVTNACCLADPGFTPRESEILS